MSPEPFPKLTFQKLVRRVHLLNDFLMVAAEGGVRQAAEKVHISQSALTRRIQDLENELGVELFERTARGMTLTKYGLALKHHAQLVELNCTYAVNEINDLLSGGAGEIRVAAGPAWAFSFVPDSIAALQKRFPHITVKLINRMNDATLPMLLAGQLDVVLGGLPASHHRDSEIHYEALIEIDHLVFAGEHHPLHSRDGLTPLDLKHYPWIWFAEAVSGRELLAAYFRNAGLEPPHSSVETTSVQSGFRLMQAANYLMLLPSTLRVVAADQGLAPLPTIQSVGRYTAGMMYRESALRLRAFSEFREELLKLTSNFSQK